MKLKRDIRQKRISARITEDTENTIKSNGLSYGDALEIVANMLKNEKSLLEYEYNKLKSENKTYENMIKANERRMKEIESEISQFNGYDLDNPTMSREIQNHIELFENNKATYGTINEYIVLRQKTIRQRCQMFGLSKQELETKLIERYTSIE